MKTTAHFTACLLACALSPFALAAGETGSASAQQRYEQERARCLSGQSQQDRETCLREAGAALQESGRGGLATGGGLGQNAVERCNAQPPADRAACVARIQGGGKTEGSVEGGGILRETETKVQ